MPTRGKPFRRRKGVSSSSNLEHHDNELQLQQEYLPFPVASITTLLFLAVLLSFLSAIYIGASRNNHNHSDFVIDVLSSARRSSSEAGSSSTNGGDGSSSIGNVVATDNTISDNDNDTDSHNDNGSTTTTTTIHSFQDLKPSEIHPIAGPNRHIVTPPADEKMPVSLVTCKTTAGYLHIAVHPSWCPLGAQRFLTMVTTKYFSSKVALMRCIKNFLCQFGIAGDPSYNKPYSGKNNNLQDDPNWLPEGPTHRKNALGVKRFGKGYLAYAGSGKNSRSNQLIVALKDNERLGGGSPWEVPWGEVVGEESFTTLDNIYTGYGEKGPSQGRLHREGSSESVQKDFPKLDYILGCDVVDSR